MVAGDGAVGVDRGTVGVPRVIRVPLVDTFHGWMMLIPISSEAMPWYARHPADPSQARRPAATPRPEPDPVADMAAGILPEPPPWAKSFGSKIQFKPRGRGGRPAGGAKGRT